MAFTVPKIVKNVEFRALNSGISGNGTQWMSLKTESLDEGTTYDWEFTVPKDLQAEVYNLGLRKGDYMQCVFTARYGRAQSGREYGYLQLDKVPMTFDDDGELS